MRGPLLKALIATLVLCSAGCEDERDAGLTLTPAGEARAAQEEVRPAGQMQQQGPDTSSPTESQATPLAGAIGENTPMAAPSPIPTPGMEVEAVGDQCVAPHWRFQDQDPEGQWLEFSDHFVSWGPYGFFLVVNDGTTIKIVNSEGTQVRTVADTVTHTQTAKGFYLGLYTANGLFADVSPDGSRIAYTTCEFRTDDLRLTAYEGEEQRYSYEIATIGVDGTGKRRLTENGHWDHYPVWSPDGTRIAFISDSPDRDYVDPKTQLFTMAADGSDRRLLTPSLDSVGFYPPVWSPDGRHIAFSVREGYFGPYEPRVLYVVGADGSGLARIAEITGVPAWSPSGNRIAFTKKDGDDVGLYTAGPDGGDLREVLSGYGGYLSWSRDGSEIFASKMVALPERYRGALAGQGIYAVRPDGGSLRLVVPYYFSQQYRGSDNFVNRLLSGPVAWSPGGTRIAFHHMLDDGREGMLFTSATDGTDLRVLALHDADGALVPWNLPGSEVQVDLAACSAGVVVPEPDANPGLVQDCETLLSIRDTLSGGGDIDWSESTPIAEWEGVSLNGSPMRVTVLRLDGTSLRGTLTPELGRLIALRQLSIWGAGLDGGLVGSSIPPELGNLMNLETLYLGDFI